MQFLHIHNYEHCTLKYKYFSSIAFAYDAVHFFHCLHRLREEEATTNATAFRGKNIYLHLTLDTTQFSRWFFPIIIIVGFLKRLHEEIVESFGSSAVEITGQLAHRDSKSGLNLISIRCVLFN